MGLEALDVQLYGGTLSRWIVAIGISAIIVLLVRLAKPLLIRRLGVAAKRTHIALDDAAVNALQSTRLLLVTVVAVEIGSQVLDLPGRTRNIVDAAATVALFLQVGLWGAAVLKFWLQRSEERARATSPGAVTSLAAVGFVGRIVLWALVLLLILDNLGINVTTLVAGLGIGGIAVALAVQNILGDLFASLSIVIDKPFVVGDFIIVDDYMGTIEHVGLKTTRIRSLSGEQVIFSNSDLLKARIRNYKRMYERRIVFKFGVVYQTTPEQLERIPPLLKRLLESQKNVRFDRAHFYAFGESSLDFEVVFWVTTADYNVYMDIQQALNLQLMRELAAMEVEFAYPTRTLQMVEPLKVEAEVPRSEPLQPKSQAGAQEKPQEKSREKSQEKPRPQSQAPAREPEEAE